MEDREKKDKYASQNNYQKKTYQRISMKLRKEWNLYDRLQLIAQEKDCSINAVTIYYLVEGMKKDGYKPSSELKEFIDNNYKKK